MPLQEAECDSSLTAAVVLRYTPELNNKYILKQIAKGSENTDTKIAIRDYQDPNPEPLIIAISAEMW